MDYSKISIRKRKNGEDQAYNHSFLVSDLLDVLFDNIINFNDTCEKTINDIVNHMESIAFMILGSSM